MAQFATFALPGDVGDFGGGAVNLMGDNDIFAVLFEYGPDSLGTRLFARHGMPRALSTRPTSCPTSSGGVWRASPAPSGSSPNRDGRSPSTWCWAAMPGGPFSFPG